MKAAREFIADMAEQVSMPAVYVAIRELLLDPDTRIDDFVDVVRRDSMLSLRVLRMARSQYFGFPRQCDDLYQAISLIGLIQLHDLMLGCLCVRSFAAIPEQVLNLRAFWRYCVHCGIAARTIGEHGGTAGAQACFTLGLLHEIGHAPMFLKAPDASLRALEASRTERADLAAIEREMLGFDYTEVGAELMRLWHLPPVYPEVAAHHLHPERAQPEFRAAVQVVHLAHALCREAGDDGPDDEIEKTLRETPEFKRLPADIETRIAGKTAAHADFVLGLLWPQNARDPRPRPGAAAHA